MRPSTLRCYLLVCVLFSALFVLFRGTTNLETPPSPIMFVQQTQRPSSADLRRVLDEEPIHIVQSFCIFHKIAKSDPGLTALRSILAARAAGPSSNRRYIIHILADIYAGWLLSNNRSAEMPWGRRLERLVPWIIGSIPRAMG